jgi:hypothetical protein
LPTIRMQNIDTPFGALCVVNEPTYSFGSTDNVWTYTGEVLLTEGRPTSIHGVTLNDQRVMIVGAGGGCSSVHDHSSLVLDDRLYVAVGNCVVCLCLSPPHALVWSVQVDTATCFGLYWEASRAALIVHGELEISRLSRGGDLLWQASGADIFTEGFRLQPNHIEAVDFNRTVYRFDYSTGEATLG